MHSWYNATWFILITHSISTQYNNKELLWSEEEERLTLIAKQRILPSETMLTNKTRASESSLLAKVSKDLVAMTAPVIWLRTATFTPLVCSSVASNTWQENNNLITFSTVRGLNCPGLHYKRWHPKNKGTLSFYHILAYLSDRLSRKLAIWLAQSTRDLACINAQTYQT